MPLEADRVLRTKVEVLADLEEIVHQLMAVHESKRVLWYPSELLGPSPDTDPDAHLRALRERARGISDPARVAIALNLLTEEGLPHFHRLLAVYLGPAVHWAAWMNMWTAEEDRHGAVLHDYAHDARLFDGVAMEKMQFAYLRAGFDPAWDRDPYRVFVYTSLQERATQFSHSATGELAGQYEPQIGTVLQYVAQEEARHYTFYRTVFKECLQRDPDEALLSAAKVMPSIEMPGHRMPHFRELADVIRRAGIYGPRQYQTIVEEQIKYWAIDAVEALTDAGRKAQEAIMAIPSRLSRIADAMDAKRTAKSFSFEITFGKEFAMGSDTP